MARHGEVGLLGRNARAYAREDAILHQGEVPMPITLMIAEGCEAQPCSRAKGPYSPGDSPGHRDGVIVPGVLMPKQHGKNARPASDRKDVAQLIALIADIAVRLMDLLVRR
jgi:hypothetical protein